MDLSDEQLIESYVRHDPKMTDAEHRDHLKAISLFQASQNSFLSSLRAKPPESLRIEEFHLAPEKLRILQCLASWILEASMEIFEFQIHTVEVLKHYSDILYDYVSQNPGTLARLIPLNRNWKASCKTHPTFTTALNRRHCLSRMFQENLASNRERDLLRELRFGLVQAASEYDSELRYAPVHDFDSLLEDYLMQDPVIKPTIEAAAWVIVEGTPQNLLSTLGELNIITLNQLRITAGPPRTVVYTVLVRYLFGIAYALSPGELMGSQEESFEFLRACEAFSMQTVRDLNLSDVIVRRYTPGLQISSLFKSKQIALLMPMEVMTNPIDLMHHVMVVLGALASTFGADEGCLSFDDTLLLLMAVMSLHPPSNAIAIASFLRKWEGVQLCALMSGAMNYFVVAVQQLCEYRKRKT
jgi:hypothetical protein